MHVFCPECQCTRRPGSQFCHGCGRDYQTDAFKKSNTAVDLSSDLLVLTLLVVGAGTLGLSLVGHVLFRLGW